MSDLTHFKDGRPAMVDISDKIATERSATAEGWVRMSAATLEKALGQNDKGDVIGIGILAGIMGAKRTADLIPLCHPLPLDKVDVDVIAAPELPGIKLTATVRTHGCTGVEMEALTAVSVAALAVYDMLKAIQKDISIERIHLIRKLGGKSGSWSSETAR